MKKIFLILQFTFFSAFCFAQSRPVISDLNAILSDDFTVKLTWTIPENTNPSINGFVILRDTKQISNYTQLDNLQPITTLASDVNFFNDKLPDSKEYYYAVLTLTDNGIYKIILPSINTTILGVKYIPTTAATTTSNLKKTKNDTNKIENTKRNVPLPPLNLNAQNSSNENFNSTQQTELGKKAMSATDEFAKDYIGKKEKIAKIFVFEQDLISPEGGDDYFLFRILKDYFVKKDFASSIVKLKDFLSIHRDENVTNRAIFYLGQAYYFDNNYENAVFRFLTVKDVYPELSKKWLDSSLDLLEIE